jgi:hypothetical protein
MSARHREDLMRIGTSLIALLVAWGGPAAPLAQLRAPSVTSPDGRVRLGIDVASGGQLTGWRRSTGSR